MAIFVIACDIFSQHLLKLDTTQSRVEKIAVIVNEVKQSIHLSVSNTSSRQNALKNILV
jgi:hypothetical protein